MEPVVRTPRTRLSRWAVALCCGITLLLQAAPAALGQEDEAMLAEGFEDAIPDLHTYRATYAGDDSRAHSGTQSLRVMPEGERGGAYFRLDDVIDRDSDCRCTAWVQADTDGAADFYVSASNGDARYTKARVTGGESGEWVQLTVQVRAEDWQDTDCDVMLAMVSRGVSWFDDVRIERTVIPDPPIETYPRVEAMLRDRADSRAVRVEPGAPIRLDATDAAFAPDLAVEDVSAPEAPSVQIPADGLLTFALDVAEPMYVTGSIRLRPDADVRPGLRAYVLSDSTLVAAPMVTAEPWGPVPVREAIPDVEGTPPPEQAELVEWLLPTGRHYLTVAGPHFRPAGEFLELQITPTDRPVREPSQTFALMTDTHVSTGRSPWMNVIMYGASFGALPHELESLQNEGVDFALIAGDMTNRGVRSDFEMLAKALDATDMPVYGCVGNHDSYRSSSRPNMLKRFLSRPWRGL